MPRLETSLPHAIWRTAHVQSAPGAELCSPGREAWVDVRRTVSPVGGDTFSMLFVFIPREDPRRCESIALLTKLLTTKTHHFGRVKPSTLRIAARLMRVVRP